jgi:CheY-like chemotaxis protein
MNAIRRKTVLLAEDDVLVRKLTAKTLIMAGFNVFQAVDGVQACEIFSKHKDEIDLLVFDVVMPNMGGIEAYRKIVAQKECLKNKILYFTGYSHKMLDEIRGGADVNFLLKPFSRKIFLEKVELVINS